MTDTARFSDPAMRGGTCDSEEFQLPLHGLFGDLELGRGSILLADEFQRCPSLVKLQLLRDWQRSLTRYRQEAMTQFARELTGGAPSLPSSERLS
jgi:hypothetical protein